MISDYNSQLGKKKKKMFKESYTNVFAAKIVLDKIFVNAIKKFHIIILSKFR